MAFINSSISSVDTTAFQISPLQINFKFKSLNNGKITVDQSGAIRSISKVYLKRNAEKKVSRPLLLTANNQVSDTVLLDTVNSGQFVLQDSIAADTTVLQSADSIVPRPLSNEGKLIARSQSDWMVGVSLFIVILMAVIRFSFSKYLQRLIDSILNYQVSNNLFLEKNMRNLRGSIFLNGLFFINISFFAVLYYKFIYSDTGVETSILSFLIALAGLLLIYLGKFIVLRTIAYIFDGVKEGKEYLHTVFIYNKNLGIFLLPVTLSVPFIAEYAAYFLLNTGLVLGIIFYLLRLFRGIKILFRKHVSIFYMILYLCALEILPLLVIYKLLISLV
ncbi:DUF4271 domain-containing protein [Marinifilum caeruleilacunae]|uniref:DUF4271 domain-containing protein n=1 Tax=Marinifilum caeruleilacunae TaxID=2499076 RepID=A0ABX1WUX1_9BACT|nr:DUF4271 domain-containing protein [Marinifilum caeruleilacunae]NOU59842.1 DUF4271 domain-containing protein [Marinifilum caeruleilacunae]